MIQVLHGTNINFMGARKWAYLFSSVLIIAGLVSMVTKGGPRLGVDFAGGTLLELRFSQKVSAADLRDAAGRAGFTDAEIQTVEGANDALFRLPTAIVPTRDAHGQLQSGPAARIKEALGTRYSGLELQILRQEIVGPKVGRELTSNAIKAILFSLVGILIYVAVRFHRWEFGAGGAISIAHDILIVLGIMTMMNREFTLTVLAAYLTIAGYSINDTIVVFDRVRENIGLKRKMPLADLMNLSINQTLSRTVLTVFTVMMTIVALYVLGGKVIHDFALAMLIGIGFGTYSSVYVASALALDIDGWQQKRTAARIAARTTAKAAAKASGRSSQARPAGGGR
jgi:preprotein translocase subunit SecF